MAETKEATRKHVNAYLPADLWQRFRVALLQRKYPMTVNDGLEEAIEEWLRKR